MDASDRFYRSPILNSPYECPSRHWELDESGQPTGVVSPDRRRSALTTPVPRPKRRKTPKDQAEMTLDGGEGLSTAEQEYNPTPIVNEIRRYVADWRKLAPDQQGVTPETARLLQHWRHHPFQGVRPFFCQVEAVETAIWLAEVAPGMGRRGAKFLEHLRGANEQANPDLPRVALKLATGAGKTTAIAMLIAWQTVNAVRRPAAGAFACGFLVVTPGVTIRDRLRVLQPNDPDSYFRHREIVPDDMLGDLDRARIVIVNYHAFRRRERMEVSKVGRALLRGRGGPEVAALETEGAMLRRVAPGLMSLKNVLVLNDEGHHCYRERPGGRDADALKGDDREEAKRNNEAARLWISGLETVKRRLGVRTVYDLSATPFFLRGSGYAEGALFPWTVSDFSLMDAIECGVVKLPRVPVADNAVGADAPAFRNLWDRIGKRMPKGRRGKTGDLDPLDLPAELQSALDALYGHYERTYRLWEEANIGVPPVFIAVCNNTASSKLVHDYIAGFRRAGEDGAFHAGRFELFRNHDEHGNRLARPRTLLIDSAQLESGDALDRNFRAMAADEIERFRREIVERTGDKRAAENLSDQDLLREAMNTVGRPGRLGESVRCVVSVSMLTEGWDCRTVTHILGVRAFGTQLLCEQVVGRALRRQSYDLNEEGRFDVEYADVLGVPFDFASRPVVEPPRPPKKTVRVHAVSPERDALEIVFPRVAGYRADLPRDRLFARFGPDSRLDLTPALIGPTITRNLGIAGEGVDLTVERLADARPATIAFHLATHLLYAKFRDSGGEPKLHLFPQLRRIVGEWLEGGWLRCAGGAFPAQVLYRDAADMACGRIEAAIVATAASAGERPVRAIPDAYNPSGSTARVDFRTSKEPLWETDPAKCHVNWAVCDSEWEVEFCRVAEAHPLVRAWVKNRGLGLEVPYLAGSASRRYVPDFVVRVDDGRGADDPLNLIVEIKGYRGEDARDKANAMRAFWVPGVNASGAFGRWGFAEFGDAWEIDAAFDRFVRSFLPPDAAA